MSGLLAACAVVAGWPAFPGDEAIRPSPDEARRWAQDELAKPVYGKSFLERFATWVGDTLAWLFRPAEGAGGSAPVPPVFAVLALVVIAAVVGTIVLLARRKHTGAAPDDDTDTAVFAAKALPAAEYRRQARAALDAGQPGRAVIEGFRAIAAQLLERHILDEAPDRTAREFATALGRPFPDHGARAAEAARAFEETLYGGLPATEAMARAVLDLDAAIQQATPLPLDPAHLPQPLAVPR